MFRFSERLSASGSNRYLRRAALFAGALVLLWIAVELMPSPTPPSPTAYADESGTVISKTGNVPLARGPRLFTPGTAFALLLLAGGGGFALYLRRRGGATGSPASYIEPLSAYAMAPGQQLRLVQCGGEVLLLGVTNSQITLLKSYPEGTFSAPPEAESSYGQPAVPAQDFANTHFADVLRHYASRYANATSSPRHAR